MIGLMIPAIGLAPSSTIVLNPSERTAILRDGTGRLELRLNTARGCVVDRLRTLGQEVLGQEVSGHEVAGERDGVWSGVQLGGRWHTTARLARPPKVERRGDRLHVSGIAYGPPSMRIEEEWTFRVKADAVDWTIERRYRDGGAVEGTAMPSMTFRSMDVWTGALLGTGGVAWGKLLDLPNATYGVHTGSASLWNPTTDACLSFAAKTSPSKATEATALRFTREPGDRLSMTTAVTPEPLRPKHGLSRFQRTRPDVWQGFTVPAGGESSATYELKATSYRTTYGRGEFAGLDTAAITELLNTIGRIGVIDEDLVGSNGWYSGYICMHEPWLARAGTALNDPNYTRACARFLDLARQHAVQPDGMVKSRWKYDAGDAQPGTYDPATGFYEAQWGRLMDSQSSYVTNVAEQFDASGDLPWLRRQKAACESALDYLLRRDADGDGLVEMENSLTGQRRSSDWLDIVWASHENALVNAQLYGALRKWAEVEIVLGDLDAAMRYDSSAKRLKASFDRPIAEGGFWNPEKGWYVYWRDADGSIHGDNLVVPVNFTALAEGICDDPARRKLLLDTIESRMRKESLVTWPSCFESYAPGEGMDDVFPKYENGDVFLAWAEYGVRAYATIDPALAVRYVRRIVDQYGKDGLAFQRYLRREGRGAGDDILANNANVIAGLYRDVYGIRPKHDRLYLEPHLVPELDGTRVEYDLRGTRLRIELSTDDYRVGSGRTVVRSTRPFGVDLRPDRLTLFAGADARPAIEIAGTRSHPVTVGFIEWDARKRWSITAEVGATTLTHRFGRLKRGMRYAVLASGRRLAWVTAEKSVAKIRCAPGAPLELELVAEPASE